MAIITWTLLVKNVLLPEGATVPHLLWAMYFLFCYPKQEEGCATAAGEKGVINSKTWCKYIWPVIYALSDVESVVVSTHHTFFCFHDHVFHVFSSGSFLRTGKLRGGTLI